MAGTVKMVGKDVKKWNPDDRVFGLLPGGGYAQYCVIPERMAMPMPENLDFATAAAIPETFLTAYQALKWLGELERTETVLIHAGGSGVGTAAIQLAHSFFNARILTTAGHEKKLQTCKELGADYAFNYNDQDFGKETISALGENTVDLIIDFIGAPYWEENIEILNTDGRLVHLAFMGGHKLPNMSLAPILKKRLKIMGSTLRNRSEAYKTKLTQEFARPTLPMFERGALKPVIHKVYDWEHTEEAHRHMNENKNTGKIVISGM
jgi:putative PIG3 family NAD(P)H quinone oxidoreductase